MAGTFVLESRRNSATEQWDHLDSTRTTTQAEVRALNEAVGWDKYRLRTVECVCVHDCRSCSYSGDWHTHPIDAAGLYGPCEVHPDAVSS